MSSAEEIRQQKKILRAEMMALRRDMPFGERAEADRDIDPIKIIRRTMQYGFAHYPQFDKEGHYARTVEHLHEKYAEGGYLKLWIPESPNAERLAQLRDIIRDEGQLQQVFEQIWQEESPINH